MKESTNIQLLERYLDAAAKYDMAKYASRVADVEKRQKDADATMGAIRAEFKRRDDLAEG